MNLQDILKRELKGSVEFFLDYTNLDTGSPGYGLTVDSTKKTQIASIASVGFALTAWVIAEARGFMSTQQAIEITRGTLRTLKSEVSHYHGFFAHYLDINSGERVKACEFSTIDTALCLNGVITAAAYFQDEEIQQLASLVLERVDWGHFVFEKEGKLLFRMAFNPDRHGAYVSSQPGFISQWDMAAEQKMMYFQAAASLNGETARSLYHGFSRDIGVYEGQPIIINPGGTLFAYQYSEAWFDFASYLDPDGIDWFNNTRLAALANRDFCIQQSSRFRTYHARSWGLSAGDCPRGYCVFGATPCKGSPRHNGTVSIYAALSCLPFIPDETLELVDYLYHRQPKTWGKYGFYDAYNLDVSPEWYSTALYGIDKGCSMIMIENYLSGLIWKTYTSSPVIQKGLQVLGFKQKSGVV
jgi:hypothetical protein